MEWAAGTLQHGKFILTSLVPSLASPLHHRPGSKGPIPPPTWTSIESYSCRAHPSYGCSGDRPVHTCISGGPQYLHHILHVKVWDFGQDDTAKGKILEHWDVVSYPIPL